MTGMSIGDVEWTPGKERPSRYTLLYKRPDREYERRTLREIQQVLGKKDIGPADIEYIDRRLEDVLKSMERRMSLDF